MKELYNRNKLGLAGEFKVMSELLLRGHNPSKSFLEEGADIVLENGLRIEVKSAHRCHYDARWKKATNNYLFIFRGGNKNRRSSLPDFDIAILWLIDDDCFLIIPSDMITGDCVGISTLSPRSKYTPYKNKWDLLDIPKEEKKDGKIKQQMS